MPSPTNAFASGFLRYSAQVIVLAAILLVVGILLPWGSAEGSNRLSGLEGTYFPGAKVGLILAVLLPFMLLLGKRRANLAAFLVGLWTVGVGVVAFLLIQKENREAETLESSAGDVITGIGYWLYMPAALLLVVVAAVSLWKARNT